MDDLSPETRALLDCARGGEILPAARRRTMRTRLAVVLGMTAPLPLVSALTASASVTTWVTRGLVVFGVAGAVGVSAAPFLVSPRVRAHDMEPIRAVGSLREPRQRGAKAPLTAPERATDPEPAEWAESSARTEEAERPSAESVRPSARAGGVGPPTRFLPVERETSRPSPQADRVGPTAALPVSRGVFSAPLDLGSGVEVAPAVQAGPALPGAPSETPASPLAPEEARVASAAPLPETPARSPASPVEGALAFEARVLTEARRAVESGDARRALSLLDEHDLRFAAGALSPESHALRVDALCAAGLTAQARAEARAFRARYTMSPLVRRFASTCAAADGDRPPTAPNR